MFIDFHMTESLSVAAHAFASRVSMSVSVDETLLPRQVNLSTCFRELPFSVEMSPVCLNTYIPFCVNWHGGRCVQGLVPDYVAEFRLG